MLVYFHQCHKKGTFLNVPEKSTRKKAPTEASIWELLSLRAWECWRNTGFLWGHWNDWGSGCLRSCVVYALVDREWLYINLFAGSSSYITSNSARFFCHIQEHLSVKSHATPIHLSALLGIVLISIRLTLLAMMMYMDFTYSNTFFKDIPILHDKISASNYPNVFIHLQ